ncbi:cell growth regulator with EF hand domain protein 1 [Myotis lucifugus]|nr:cell growth regulator with EF hand domain protein 1 [Myotis lucifugus]
MSMLTAALAPGTADSPTTNPVVLVVDEVLETQDLNGDGLMTPAELVNFPGAAPRHSEHQEPPEPQDLGRQPPLAKSPSGQEAQEALGPRGEEGQVEAGKEPLEPGQEAGEKAPGAGGEAGAQAEARDAGKEAEEQPGETVEPKNPPSEFEVHAIQLENDEI